jgi:hypothetical protein
VSSKPVPSAASVVGRLQPGDALQQALAAEYAAIYGYGLVAARLTGNARSAATDAYVAHRSRCDTLVGLITAAHLKPVAAAPSYALPFPVGDAGASSRLAAYMEDRAAAIYADLVAVVGGATRAFALGALCDAAERYTFWSGTATAFPGLAELG